jgi:hypothetical protein
MSHYFYKLGHIPSLALNEFILTSNASISQIKASNKYLFLEGTLDQLVDINLLGSFIFSGSILYQAQKTDLEEQNYSLQKWFLDHLENYLRDYPTKELGIAITKPINDKILFKICKNSGVKKLTIVDNQKLNFGYWKKTKNWLFCDIENDRIFIGQLTSYFNQEKWAKLDTQLQGDMKRGLINLKLARSLNNLTKEKIIWDPFCGVGRNSVASHDNKDGFYLSDHEYDITEKAILANIKMTLELDKKILGKGQLDANNLDLIKLAQTNLNSEDQDLDNLKQSLSIVTEGYLGTNIGTKLSDRMIKTQYYNLQKLWTNLFISIKNNNLDNINEVVFCLPFYLYNTKLSNLCLKEVRSWLQKSNYKLQQFYELDRSKVDFLLYKREKTFVGHAIFKAVKKANNEITK